MRRRAHRRIVVFLLSAVALWGPEICAAAEARPRWLVALVCVTPFIGAGIGAGAAGRKPRPDRQVLTASFGALLGVLTLVPIVAFFAVLMGFGSLLEG